MVLQEAQKRKENLKTAVEIIAKMPQAKVWLIHNLLQLAVPLLNNRSQRGQVKCHASPTDVKV